MIRDVALAGLGAVGAIYASRMDAYLTSEHTYIIVDEVRKNRYRKDRVFLNGEERTFNFALPEEVGKPVDLLIIATKNNHLEQLIPTLSPLIGKNTVILSLLNGIASEKLLEKAYPEAHVLYGFVTALDSTKLNNRIEYATEGIIYFGEKNNEKSNTVQLLSSFFDACGIASDNPEDIHTQMWAKYMVNVSINTVSAVCRAGYGPCVSVPAIWSLIEAIMREVITLGTRAGIRGLDETFIARYKEIFSSLTENGKTSMLQDVEAGRVSENRWFCMFAGTMGRELGVPTPHIDMLGQIMEGIDAVHERS